MTLPVRHLPLLQNWDCQGCGNCCHEYRIYLDDGERERIVGQGWKPDELAGLPPLVRARGRWRLNHRDDGGCVFLTAQGRCGIHARFGAEAKPLACRLYPFVLVPVDDHWRVGLRYSCPAAAANEGKELKEHLGDLRHYAADQEAREPLPNPLNAPPLQGSQCVAWPDLLAFNRVLLDIMLDRSDRIERRWRKCLALAALCRQAKFDQVTGSRLVEFLKVVRGGLDAEVPVDPGSVSPPSGVGRILFRLALAAHVRKDHGRDRGPAITGRWSLFRAALAFARGRGAVPRLHALIPETTFEELEAPKGSVPAAFDEVLERYYVVKLNALQYCGPVHFGRSLWDGLDALALTLPAVLWLTRAARDGAPARIAEALQVVDHPFGYSPLLGAGRMRFTLGILSRRVELPKLIAWYSR